MRDMSTAVFPADSAAIDDVPPAVTKPRHWLEGIYFIRSPDISNETREAINKGKSMPLWEALQGLLHDLERRGATPAIKAAAVAGRIDHLGIKGIAKAIKMSPTTVLRQVRHLEGVVGIIETDQRDYTRESDPATGKIVRNYARAEPKAVIVTIKPHHLRPARAVQSTRRKAPEPNPKSQGGCIEPNPKTGKDRVRNWLDSKESNLHRGLIPSESNGRPASAGPLGRPASSSAEAHAAPPAEPDWLVRERQARTQMITENVAYVLGMPADEVTAIKGQKGLPEIERLLREAGVENVNDVTHYAFRKKWRLRVERNRSGVAQTLDIRDDLASRLAVNPGPQDAGLPAVEAGGHPAAKASSEERQGQGPSPAAYSTACGPSAGEAATETIERDRAADELQKSLDELPADSPRRARDLGHGIDDGAAAVQRIIDEKRRQDLEQDRASARAREAAAIAEYRRLKSAACAT